MANLMIKLFGRLLITQEELNHLCEQAAQAAIFEYLNIVFHRITEPIYTESHQNQSFDKNQYHPAWGGDEEKDEI